MKKTGAILGITCILAVALYFLVTVQTAKITAADFLPDDVLVSMEQRDLGELYDDFKDSRFGSVLAGIDYVKIATSLELDPAEIDTIKDIRHQLVEFMGSPVFNEFLGREFTLALVPFPAAALEVPEQMTANSLLLISKPRHNTDILELLSSLFTKQLEQTSIQHGQYQLKQFLIEDGMTVTVATIEGYVIAAFNEQLIKESLDRFDSKQNSLAYNQEYMRLRAEFVEAKLFTYISTPALYRQANRWTEDLDQDQKENIQKTIDQWKGWEGLAFGAWKEKNAVRDKAVVLFSKEQLDPLVARMCAVSPVDNKTLAMIPADILGYYWTNTFDMQIFWEIFIREMQGNTQPIAALEQNVKLSTGRELSQLLAMFGSEAAILLKDIATDGFIPLPNGALFVKIEKKDEFEKMVAPLLLQANIPTETEEYKGIKLVSWGVSLHPSLQPVYALHQGYLIMASTMNLIKEIIDSPGDYQEQPGATGARAGGLSGALINDSSFQQINEGLHQGLSEVNNSVTFVRFSSLLQMLKELASWGGVMLSMQDRESALKSTVLLEELLLPLLDVLAMYDVMGGRTTIQDDAIILESNMILAK